MRVLVLGGSGLTGGLVVRQALAEGVEVAVLSRAVRPPAGFPTDAEWFTGDALDPADLARALDGADAVIHCLGIGGHGTARADTTVSRSMRALVEAIGRRTDPPPRIVVMSNVGVGSSAEAGGILYRRILWPALRATVLRWLAPILDDKELAEAELRAAGLPATIVRMPNIVDRPARGRWRVGTGTARVGLSLGAADAARWLLDAARETGPGIRTISLSN